MAKSSSSSDVGKSGETAVPAKPQDYSSATTNSQQQAKLDRLESKEKQTVTKPMEEKQRDNENRFSKLNKIWDAEVKQESTVTSPAMDLKRILGLNTAIDPPSQQQQLPAKEETVADSVPRDFSGPTKRGSRVKAGGETSIPSDSSSSNSNTTEERKSTPLTAVSTATEGSRPNSLMMERTSLSASWAGVPPNLLATSANQKAAADHPSLGKTDLSASYPLGSLLSGLMSVQQKEQQQLAARDSVAGSYAVQKSQSLTSEQMRDYNPAIRRQQQKSSSPSEIEFEKLHKDMESFIDTVGNVSDQSAVFSYNFW